MNFRKYKILFLAPLIYFIIELIKYFNSVNHIGKCDIAPFLHSFLLNEFIIICIIIFYENHINIKKYIKQNISILAVFIVLLITKLYMLYISEITIDIIYLVQILFTIILELVPLLLLKPFMHKKSINLFYTFLLILIISLNIAIAIYYYYTSELIEPLIYDNIGLTSIKGFFTNYSIFEILLVAVLLFLLGSFIYKFESRKIDNFKIYYKKIIVFTVLFFLFYKILFYLEKNSVRRLCELYGYQRGMQNKIVNKITTNSFYVFINAYIKRTQNKNIKFNKNIVLFKDELEQLKRLGLYKAPNNPLIQKKYNRIIIIAFESLSIDFLNFYNKKIPKELTPYFNYLLNNYFHLNNYRTSDMPTDYGWTAILKSKIDLNINAPSLFSVLEQNGYTGYYIMGSSKFFGRKSYYYPQAFKFQKWYFQEKLKKEYGNLDSGWGFHNDIVFDKALKILKQNKNKKILLCTETVDFHQPGPYCGISKDKLPKILQNKDDKILKSIYWIDRVLNQFITNLKKSNLFDEKTLIIITADHNPHPGFEFKKYALKNNYRRLARIPLIFITKNKDFAKFKYLQNKDYSEIDTTPTILSILGYDDKKFMGNNIFNKDRKTFVTLGKYSNNLYYHDGNISKIIDIKNPSIKDNVIVKYFEKNR